MRIFFFFLVLPEPMTTISEHFWLMYLSYVPDFQKDWGGRRKSCGGARFTLVDQTQQRFGAAGQEAVAK